MTDDPITRKAAEAVVAKYLPQRGMTGYDYLERYDRRNGIAEILAPFFTNARAAEREAVLEEAARVCDTYANRNDNCDLAMHEEARFAMGAAFRWAAFQLRALRSKPSPAEQEE